MTEHHRASKIIIDIPKEDSEPWVHVTIDLLLKDDNEITQNVIPRVAYISKPLSEIASEMYDFNDPILQKDNTLSGYGLAQAISSYVNTRMKEKYGA